MVNYLALLGWSIGDDRDIFTPAELVAAFDGHRISGNPARFDRKKAESINGAHLRLLAPEDFADRLLGYLVARGDLPAAPSDRQVALVAAAAPLVQERSALLSEAALMIRFLTTAEFAVDPAAASKVLTAAALPVLASTIATVRALPEFTAAALEPALKSTLVDELGFKPKVAFAPVRVAVTGRTISPPLYESMELLGRDQTLVRLRAALRVAGG
jgi:glutamyl-tRNA synthetase